MRIGSKSGSPSFSGREVISVPFRFDTGDEKVDSVAALVLPVVIPGIGDNSLSGAVFGLAVVLRDADFCADDFQHIGKLSAALAPECA